MYDSSLLQLKSNNSNSNKENRFVQDILAEIGVLHKRFQNPLFSLIIRRIPARIRPAIECSLFKDWFEVAAIIKAPDSMVSAHSAISDSSKRQCLINKVEDSVINDKRPRTGFFLKLLFVPFAEIVKRKWFRTLINERNSVICVIPLNNW